MKVLHVVGARPNFMKIAPIMREMGKDPARFQQALVHTGQHYDPAMSLGVFKDLDLPRPDWNLNVGSCGHAVQTGRIMIAFEPIVQQWEPDLVVVVGDVNSTLACALTAVKLHVPVAHVEAGLRSYDRKMPEEINRVLTDQVAKYLFTTEEDARENLTREGITPEKIHFVGNVMIDTLLYYKEQALALGTPAKFGLEPQRYALLTVHRPINVDVPEVFSGILDALEEIQDRIPVLFTVHPRTLRRIEEFGVGVRLGRMSSLQVTGALGYLEFLDLMANARLVLTDSGGVQEETTVLGVPCLTLRPRTERPITVFQGTNTVIGSGSQHIVAKVREVLCTQEQSKSVPALWDGHTAERIVEVLSYETR